MVPTIINPFNPETRVGKFNRRKSRRIELSRAINDRILHLDRVHIAVLYDSKV